jgi:hypothetical protein
MTGMTLWPLKLKATVAIVRPLPVLPSNEVINLTGLPTDVFLD